jgi:hypothetical protein
MALVRLAAACKQVLVILQLLLILQMLQAVRRLWLIYLYQNWYLVDFV